jgi:hypothetical protein
MVFVPSTLLLCLVLVTGSMFHLKIDLGVLVSLLEAVTVIICYNREVVCLIVSNHKYLDLVLSFSPQYWPSESTVSSWLMF